MAEMIPSLDQSDNNHVNAALSSTAEGVTVLISVGVPVVPVSPQLAQALACLALDVAPVPESERGLASFESRFLEDFSEN